MESKSHEPTALHEVPGINQPNTLSHKVVSTIQQFRKKQPTANELIEGILAQNITALSRAITLVESTNSSHLEKANEVIHACLPYANQSVRIGITGVPGVGKSTFIEAFGKYLTGIGKKVAVLAVDPSSSMSFGSILGDKTRMEELVKDPNAYIRPSPSGDTLGGVARKTRETITLCEAFGYDTIIIETVGVGQSETAVHSMVDFFLLLKIAGAGDELQGIKRGIMEMADAIVINKADGDNIKKAQMAKVAFNRALHLFPAKKSGWIPTTATCSALVQDGISEVWDSILNYLDLTQSNGYFEEKRRDQNQYWMLETINESLKNSFFNKENIKNLLIINKKAVQDGRISPFAAAQILLQAYFE
ncbi:ATPase/protein kinase [Flavobacterium branchiophilum]|uniref:Methylmalonyl-CoA mutase metallochaperone MeaB n=1 Tax=Flavobacterium branchiophilum TaxID=55197 RepID=A0A543G6L7_9FLAO|nr:methylmalonyl Co-A mutase-associated GTPase MeaB [Flavobacterium branchiophilum]OXA75606.1 ATPase/protein kinase [Flavobacterium branchiophilum] [Flavobacterium branchiophilum NBRC 15030 = ATCC 35035]TQM41736.1 methylmalonyl-CoA mutase metallochaperone MeaB [Flavobacterium branchiophilum]GEM55436.1 ATPase/protein kinase [Flavobacterium branchiophilum NBRC 15030 = ATCC 35035]